MTNPHNPCQHCQDRAVHCSKDCERWKNYKAEKDAYREAVHKQRQSNATYESIHIDRVRKCKSRWR